MLDTLLAPTEFKFVSDGEPGRFSGYGSVNHVLDSHGDVITPGAFAKSLEQHKANGTMPALFVQHSKFTGGDPLPVGVWTDIKEDEKGLRVEGKLSALDTDHGKRIYSLMKDGALKGLSIAYSIPEGGAIINRKAAVGQPKRILNQIDLHAIDIVHRPSNGEAMVENLRSVMMTAEHPAVSAIVSAYKLHRATTAGGDSMSKSERDAMTKHLEDAHFALTGQALKWTPTTIRELENFLRDEGGFSKSQASEIAAHGFKSATRRDDGGIDTAPVATKTLADEIGGALAGFSLPKFDE
jgi:HK97 family phage prohead protease